MNQSEGDVSLTLEDDGNFVAQGWPTALCYPRVSSFNEIDWQSRVTFEGTYVFLDHPYIGFLESEDDICSGVSFYFWKGSGEARWIQLDLIPDDGSEPSELIRLDRVE